MNESLRVTVIRGKMKYQSTRNLTQEEYLLAKWLLENGNGQARDFLGQLEDAEATTWKCECGCASFNFKIRGMTLAEPGVTILSDYVFGSEENMAGVFIFSSGGILKGLEVYGLAGDAPARLPEPSELVPMEENQNV